MSDRFGLRKTRIFAAITSMLLLLSSCSSGKPAQSGPSASSSDSGVTLTLMTNETGMDGWNDMQSSDVAKEILKKTGVSLQIESVDNDKYNVVLASNDLPDIIRTQPYQFAQLIEGGNVIALDDLVATNGKDMQQSIPDTLAFSKEHWSDGQNKLYFIPAHVGVDAMGNMPGVGFSVRWDWYKELGYPKIGNIDDFLNVASQMVKKHPATPSGKKVYGFSLWSDGGAWPFIYPMAAVLGYGGYASSNCVMMVKTADNSITCTLTDENAPYWKSVEFYYKAEQLGLLDPDSFTQKNADRTTKVNNNGVCIDSGAGTLSNVDPTTSLAGYAMPSLDWGYQWNGIDYKMGWIDKDFAITKSCKSPEKAMDLLNYVWSYEGSRTLQSGVVGLEWNDEGGAPQLLPDTINNTSSDAVKKRGISSIYGGNFCGLSGFTVDPADNQPLSLFNTTSVYETQAKTNAIYKDFCQHYGTATTRDVFQQKLKDGVAKDQSSFNSYAAAVMPQVPDDIVSAEANLGTLMQQYAAKCILSGSDSSFQTVKAEAIGKFRAAGADTVSGWYQDAWNKAKAETSNN